MSGQYSGTTTTYGTETTYIPITVNRYDKFALYFMEVPRYGAGIFPRELNPLEVNSFQTRRAFAVRFVRDGSPAYEADILPGDVILMVNGQPADPTNWQAAIRGDKPLQIQLARNGQRRELTLTIPPDWKPKE